MARKDKTQDNPTAFKLWINDKVVKRLSDAIKSEYPEFNSKEFLKVIGKLPPLELKARVLLITEHLRIHLPKDYKKSLNVLMNAMENGDLKGFELWPFSEYISQCGLDHFDESLRAMYRLTRRFTAEFAIRPFLLEDHKKVLKTLAKWTQDENVHVRRWISEGTRPLLPWGARIPIFVMDPTHTLFFLDKLRYDEELYVRKSVANHLNDIAKNHPQVVIEILRMWSKDVPEIHADKIEWIKKHALRTLVKKGHPAALKILGVSGSAKVKVVKSKLAKKVYKLGEKLQLEVEIVSDSNKKQKLIVDYGIDFMKANGKKGTKIFKLKTFELSPQELVQLNKTHSLKPITTMKYYPGEHHLTIQINGEVVKTLDFVLKM